MSVTGTGAAIVTFFSSAGLIFSYIGVSIITGVAGGGTTSGF
jgi:hypothetical protein